MSANTETKRITLDIPSDLHRKLKAIAALLGVTLKDYIIGCVEKKTFSNEPKEPLRKAMEDSSREKGLSEYKDIEDLIKKLDL
ncbi:MAG: hypothetical protein K1060chlam2_00313 [Chlamydiae bacterium]|nr:hypothetical protein [Chlamydiota bacterium]